MWMGWTPLKRQGPSGLILKDHITYYLQTLLNAKRSNQSILKEINPEHSLEGLIWSWSSNTLEGGTGKTKPGKRCWENKAGLSKADTDTDTQTQTRTHRHRHGHASLGARKEKKALSSRGLGHLRGFLELQRPWGFSPEARWGSQGASRAAPGMYNLGQVV